MLRIPDVKLLFAVAGLLLSACSASGPPLTKERTAIATPATVTPSVTPSWTEQTRAARKTWKAAAIQNYRMTLQMYENFANGLIANRTVEVRNGSVVRSECDPKAYKNLRFGQEGEVDFCPKFVLSQVRTVEDLFELAEGRSIPEEANDKKSCIGELSFNSTLGYPESIHIDCSEWSDDENYVNVIAFEVIQ